MKPLHHYLRRFCSEQVQLLLQRMDEHYADEFADYDSKWEPYVTRGGEAFNRYTGVEMYCVTCTRDEQNKIYKRQQMLDGILVRTMSSARNRYEFEREQEGEAKVKQGPKKMVISKAQLDVAQKLFAAQQNSQIAAHYQQYQNAVHSANSFYKP